MKISTFFYTIKQGIANIFHNKWYSLASIATISACLFLFGIFYALVSNFQSILQNLEEKLCVTVFFEEDMDYDSMQEIGRMIRARDEVSEARFVTEDQVWESVKQDWFGDRMEELEEAYPENPMKGETNFEVFLKDPEMQESLVAYLESLPGVRLVNKSMMTAQTLVGVNRMISFISAGIILILLVVSVFLISNTVTMGISVRKEEINIMKYIGATDFFVRVPFVLEGILIGLVGAVIPVFLLYNIYDGVLRFVTERFQVLDWLLKFKPSAEIFRFLTPVSLCVGVGIGFLGSFITVRKHLRV